MKTRKYSIATAILPIFLTTAFFSSCTKEEINNTTANTSAIGMHLQQLKDVGGSSSVSRVQNQLDDADAAYKRGHGSNGNCNSLVFPPNANMYGKSYSRWSAAWWKWGMEFPLTGHPFVDDASFNVSAGQTGQVWFLAAPFGTVVRNITIPHGKALFVGLLNAEASDLEGLGNTAADQLATSNFLADHIINAACTIDGDPINNLGAYRAASPQFSFTAPNPWIFSPAPSGAGTSVADGYYLMVKPLQHGNHVIHYTGSFHFTLADDGFDFDADVDMIYNITVN